jgi:hypothetical protein
MEDRCPICDDWKKLKWIGYVGLQICKSCHSEIDIDLVNKKLPFIIEEYSKASGHCLGWVIECLINDEEITPAEYLSCCNFLVKEKVLYQCYLSFQQFSFESDYLEKNKNDIIVKLKSLLTTKLLTS